jgi:hypothetical protein
MYHFNCCFSWILIFFLPLQCTDIFASAFFIKQKPMLFCCTVFLDKGNQSGFISWDQENQTKFSVVTRNSSFKSQHVRHHRAHYVFFQATPSLFLQAITFIIHLCCYIFFSFLKGTEDHEFLPKKLLQKYIVNPCISVITTWTFSFMLPGHLEFWLSHWRRKDVTGAQERMDKACFLSHSAKRKVRLLVSYIICTKWSSGSNRWGAYLKLVQDCCSRSQPLNTKWSLSQWQIYTTT